MDRKRAPGFSLVEAVVSLGLIFLAAVILVQIVPSTRKGLQLSENHATAASLGKGLLDEARSLGFDKVSGGRGALSQAATIDGVETVQQFQYSVDVASPDADRKLVWATVTWREATGDKTVVLETLLTRR